MGGKKAKGSNDAVVQEQRAQATEARAKEDQRAARIAEGQAKIKAAFEGSPVMASRKVAKTRQVANPAYSAPQNTWSPGADSAGSDSMTSLGGRQGGSYQNLGSGDSNSSIWVPDDASTQQGSIQQASLATPTVDPYTNETYYEDESYDTGQKTGGFDDKFYDQFGQSVSDYYLPQVNKQYADAGKELTYRLSRSGNLRSKAAADETADLSNQYDLNKANVQQKADAAKTDLRNTVAGQRAKIENALIASEDPTQAANQSLAAVRDISLQQPELSPLGAIFNIANIGGANFLRGAQNAKYAAAFPEGTLPTNRGKVIG